MSNYNISSNWKSFNRIWVFVAIVLFILLLLLWLLGFAPWNKNCKVSPTIIEKTVKVEKIVDSPKLLSRISALEAENLKIPALMTTIDDLKKEKVQISNLTNQIKILEADGVQLSDSVIKIKSLEADNSQIAGLKSKIVALEGANKQISSLQAELKMLTLENAKIAGFQNRIKELESDAANVTTLKAKVKDLDSANSKALSLQSQIEKLEAQNQLNPNLQAEITALQSTKPKVVEKVVESTVRVPATPDVAAPQKVIPASVSPATNESAAVVIPMAKLYFDRGSSQFPADDKRSLSSVISYLHKNTSVKAVLSGFHDPSGNLINNQKLSLARAKAVSKLLQDSGISSARIVITKPAQTEGTGSPEEARRVEVRIAD